MDIEPPPKVHMEPEIIILGAGAPHRGTVPAALNSTSGRKRVMDWILDALRVIPGPRVRFVGGYGIEEVMASYPEVDFVVNPHWKDHGILESLRQAGLKERETWICYSDIVFRDDLVQAMQAADADLVVALDPRWENRYHGRSEEDRAAAETLDLDGITAGAVQEFAGVLRLSPQAAARVAMRLQSPNGYPEDATLLDVIHTARDDGLSVEGVAADGQWAELNEPADLAQFILGTKAQTLRRLEGRLGHAVIDPQYAFTVAAWQESPEKVVSTILDRFADTLVVRSSASHEDGWTESMAGAFESILDVAPEPQALHTAITHVVDSYGDGAAHHEVLVQPMVRDVQAAGVALTRGLETGSPYLTINYEEEGGTAGVTGGEGGTQTLIIHRAAPRENPLRHHPVARRVLDAVQELEDLLGHDSLDVEFALTDDGTLHILQVRALVLDRLPDTDEEERISQALDATALRLKALHAPAPQVLGSIPAYGVMPDWNPAEIIGTRPRRLALDLYRYLIMDEVWATQRAECGYRDVRPQPLLIELAGHPYVDARASLNSFLPASLPEDLASRLMEHYLNRLQEHPEFHDKLEFEVAFTCLTPDFDDRFERQLRPAGFTDEDREALRNGLREVTADVIRRTPEALATIDHLEKETPGIRAIRDPLVRARHHLERCRAIGTLPFSHLARAGFVAVSLLRGMQASDVITQEQMDAFLLSVDTVASRFEADGASVAEGTLTWEEFVARYGHLRPGTYEATSPRYDADPERFLRPMVQADVTDRSDKDFEWDQATTRRVLPALDRLGLDLDMGSFAMFLRQAIEGREHAKFVFTRNLSDAIEAFIEYGAASGFDRDDVSHLDLATLLALSHGTPAVPPSEALAWNIGRNRESHALLQRTELPPLVFAPDDLWGFRLPPSHPNFVTRGMVRADAVALAATAEDPDLAGRIVLVPQADPGYDWLFGHRIGGLITMYGGANSHMAIRAAELGLPAAIGVGESLYTRLSRAASLELDCANQRIQVIR